MAEIDKATPDPNGDGGNAVSQPRAERMACLWEGNGRIYRLAIVGTGPGFMAILDIASNPIFRTYLPDLEVVAVAEPGLNRHKLDYAVAQGLPIYQQLSEMLIEHPDIDLLIDLTGHRHSLRHLREDLPYSISFIDQDAAIFLCGLHDMAKSTNYFRDSLDRQRHLLQAIIDEVREDILLLDMEGRVVDMNRNVWERTGKTKEEMLGRPCHEALTRADGELFCPGGEESCPRFTCMGSGHKEEQLLTRVSEDGRLLYYRIYAYPIYNQTGKQTHVMIMHRDITARTLREKNQQQTDKLAVIGEMSTYLAHEIRNPLMAIGGFTQSLMKSANLTDKEREKLSIIADETRRLDRLLAGILNFARPTKAPLGVVDLPRMVEESVELMRAGYGKQGYTFEESVAPDLPKVKGGEELVKQCLVNMIKNAMEAMEGGGVVRVSAGLEQDLVYLRVEDSGVGMTEADMDKVFSPFYTTKDKGYGLGLAMMKKIVEELGGHIDLTSKLGEGTSVTIYFPPLLAGEEGRDLPEVEAAGIGTGQDDG